MEVLVISNAPQARPKSTAAETMVGAMLLREENSNEGESEGGVGTGTVMGPASVVDGRFGVREKVLFPLVLEGE